MEKKLNYVKIPGSQFQRKVFTASDLSGSLDNQYVRLSSSVGQIISSSISLSGTLFLDAPAATRSGQIVGTNGFLILSATIGSVVHVSGTLTATGLSAGGGSILGGVLQNQGATAAVAATGLRVGSALGLFFVDNTTQSSAGEIRLNRLVGQTSTLQFSGSSGSVCLTSQAGHLILSSTIGSIVKVSSSLLVGEYASSALPAGSTQLSGAIIYVTDKKALSIYGPEGWVRLLSGTL